MNKILIAFFSLLYLPFSFSEVDPFQDLNEKTHNLNRSLDDSFATPIATFYRKVTPDFIESSVTNFTDNIEDVNINLKGTTVNLRISLEEIILDFMLSAKEIKTV